MKILLAPDSFKGTLPAREVARIWTSAFRGVLPSARIEAIPLVDGGEGTLEALHLAKGGEFIKTRIPAADRHPVEAQFLIWDGNVAVLEL